MFNISPVEMDTITRPPRALTLYELQARRERALARTKERRQSRLDYNPKDDTNCYVQHRSAPMPDWSSFDFGFIPRHLHPADLEKGVQHFDGSIGRLYFRHPYPQLPGPNLPKKVQFQPIRNARYIWFNVYRRLFSLVFILNMFGFVALFYRDSGWTKNPPLEDFATAASANILLAILIRQDYIINLFFKTAWIVPLSAPLRFRRILAKVYEFGGVHSGSAVSSVLWFILLTVFITQQFVVDIIQDTGLLIFTFLLLILLVSITVTAFPRYRFKSHDSFEQIHRWGGWISLTLFWVELLLFSRTKAICEGIPFAVVFFCLPSFWLLLVASFHAILPWFRLHKLYVKPEVLGRHAIQLHFEEPIPCFVGIRIAENPLGEWHSFACIPSRDGGQSGGSIIISDAGDWTHQNINDPKPFYWIKGIPITGVLCMAKIFRKVVIVTTGSGIGPCLGVMQDIPDTAVRVIWSTPSPHKTYGANIINSVRVVDQEAIIWDTKMLGRPNLVQMTWELYLNMGAEAVFVISNPSLTKKLVYAMESRGIPAFGPIWDS